MKTELDRYRILFDSSSDPHFIIDETGILDCNDAMVRILKCASKNDVLKIHPAQLSPQYQPDGENSIEKSKRMDAIARERGWHRFEWVHRRTDGVEFPVEVVINAVEIGGKPVAIVVWHDLTEIKKNEKRLTEMAGELSAKNAALTRANERMSAELGIAASAQQSLLPQASPFFPGIRAEWVFRPSRELAGDSLNVFRVDDNHLGFYVLDVSGHGVSSALLSVTVTQFLTSFQSPTGMTSAGTKDCYSCPITIASRLNDHFSVNGMAGHFFTMVYGVLNTRTRSFSYVSAGQAGPVIVRKDGAIEPCHSTGLPIGLLPDAEFEGRDVQLSPGDRIYLFSDGVYEAKKTDSEEYGFERLLPFLESMRPFSLKDGVDRLVREVEHWTYPEQPHDDMSLIAIETSASPSLSRA